MSNERWRLAKAQGEGKGEVEIEGEEEVVGVDQKGQRYCFDLLMESTDDVPLSLEHMAYFLAAPTLCYQHSYPRFPGACRLLVPTDCFHPYFITTDIIDTLVITDIMHTNAHTALQQHYHTFARIPLSQQSVYVGASSCVGPVSWCSASS